MPAHPVVRHLQPAGHALPLPRVVPIPILWRVLRDLRHAHVRLLPLLRTLHLKSHYKSIIFRKQYNTYHNLELFLEFIAELLTDGAAMLRTIKVIVE